MANLTEPGYYTGPAGMAMKVTYPMRALFYLMTPAETSPTTLKDAPDFVTASFPFFIVLLVVEVAVALSKGRNIYQVNDAVTSRFAGALSRAPEYVIIVTNK